MDVKKLLRIEDNFDTVVENTKLEGGVDYWDKRIGDDVYHLLTNSAIERIRELYE